MRNDAVEIDNEYDDVSEWSEYLTGFHGINKYFYDKIVSGGVGLKKPDSEIFEMTLSRLGCRAEDCVFIDNNVDNLNVAAEFGIKPILFNRDGVTYGGTIVNNFSELEAVLTDKGKDIYD